MNTLLRISTLLLTVLAGSAIAQVQLTQFQAGEAIIADEVNANFLELADAVNAVADGEYRIHPYDMAARSSAVPYRVGLNQKITLDLEGAYETNDTQACFVTFVRLPNGAEVAELGSTLSANYASGDVAEAYFLRRPVSTTGSEAPTTIASNVALTSSYQESATVGGELPETIDNDAFLYEYVVCLTNGGNFLGGRLSYTLP